MRARNLAILSIFLLAAGAAVPVRAGDSTLLGTGLGAALGGLAGSQFGHGSGQIVATGVGITVGGVIGNSIGQSMEYANSTSFSGGGYAGPYESPSPIMYHAPAPNYVAPPAPDPIYVEAGTYCRAYSQRIRINGQWQESYGTACLQPDGAWRIVQ